MKETTEAILARSRAARASVVELERLLRLGERVLAGVDSAMLARNYHVSGGQIAEARILALAERRGCFAVTTPFTLEQARIAAGIE